MDYDYDLYDSEVPVDNYVYYNNIWDEEKEEESAMTFEQVFTLCLKPTLYDSFQSIYHILLWSFLFRWMPKSIP